MVTVPDVADVLEARRALAGVAPRTLGLRPERLDALISGELAGSARGAAR